MCDVNVFKNGPSTSTNDNGRWTEPKNGKESMNSAMKGIKRVEQLEGRKYVTYNRDLHTSLRPIIEKREDYVYSTDKGRPIWMYDTFGTLPSIPLRAPVEEDFYPPEGKKALDDSRKYCSSVITWTEKEFEKAKDYLLWFSTPEGKKASEDFRKYSSHISTWTEKDFDRVENYRLWLKYRQDLAHFNDVLREEYHYYIKASMRLTDEVYDKHRQDGTLVGIWIEFLDKKMYRPLTEEEQADIQNTMDRIDKRGKYVEKIKIVEPTEYERICLQIQRDVVGDGKPLTLGDPDSENKIEKIRKLKLERIPYWVIWDHHELARQDYNSFCDLLEAEKLNKGKDLPERTRKEVPPVHWRTLSPEELYWRIHGTVREYYDDLTESERRTGTGTDWSGGMLKTGELQLIQKEKKKRKASMKLQKEKKKGDKMFICGVSAEPVKKVKKVKKDPEYETPEQKTKRLKKEADEVVKAEKARLAKERAKERRQKLHVVHLSLLKDDLIRQRDLILKEGVFYDTDKTRDELVSQLDEDIREVEGRAGEDCDVAEAREMARRLPDINHPSKSCVNFNNAYYADCNECMIYDQNYFNSGFCFEENPLDYGIKKELNMAIPSPPRPPRGPKPNPMEVNKELGDIYIDPWTGMEMYKANDPWIDLVDRTVQADFDPVRYFFPDKGHYSVFILDNHEDEHKVKGWVYHVYDNPWEPIRLLTGITRRVDYKSRNGTRLIK